MKLVISTWTATPVQVVAIVYGFLLNIVIVLVVLLKLKPASNLVTVITTVVVVC